MGGLVIEISRALKFKSLSAFDGVQVCVCVCVLGAPHLLWRLALNRALRQTLWGQEREYKSPDRLFIVSPLSLSFSLSLSLTGQVPVSIVTHTCLCVC